MCSFHTKVCAGCNGGITSGEKGVSSTREKELIFWHEDCFKCNSCEEKIVDFIYFWHEDNIYCGRHFAEKFRPRCSACDEVCDHINTDFSLLPLSVSGL